MLDDDGYVKWKSLAPFTYDWFAHTRTSWPSLCARWGDVLDANAFKTKQRVFLTEQTDVDDTKAPNTIVICQCDVLKARVSTAEAMVFDEHEKSPTLRKERSVAHPGEVNRMRCVPGREHVLVTHTDAAELFVYDIEERTEVVRRSDGSYYHAPTCALRGHTENAEYALAVSASGGKIASGGKDAKVLIWTLDDAQSAALGTKRAKSGEEASASVAVVGGGLNASELESHPNCWARAELNGHTDTVEDVVFNPHNAEELVSVGDDGHMFFWDARTKSASGWAKKAHRDDVHAVGWSVHDEHVVVTGSKDTTVKVWDRRTLSDDCTRAMYEFDSHIDSVLCVDMNPAARGVFMTSDEVGRINVFDYTRAGAKQTVEQANAGPAHLIFQHLGHRGTVWDISWNPYEPWTVLSTSVGELQNTLQMWRMNDLIYRPVEECIDELMKHRDVICGRQKKDDGKKRTKEDAKEDADYDLTSPDELPGDDDLNPME